MPSSMSVGATRSPRPTTNCVRNTSCSAKHIKCHESAQAWKNLTSKRTAGVYKYLVNASVAEFCSVLQKGMSSLRLYKGV